MRRPSDYAVTIRRLHPDLGSGFVAIVPDLPGCLSDGETPREAYENVQDAIECWIEAAQEMNHSVPEPSAPDPGILKRYA